MQDGPSVVVTMGGGPPWQSPLQKMTVEVPWERVDIDLRGRHPRFQLSNKEAPLYVEYWLRRSFLGTKSLFKSLVISDRSSTISSYGWVFTVIQADKMSTSPYKASTNRAKECFHQTLNAMLGRVVSVSQRDCDVRVTMVMAAYRASRHEAKEYSPNFEMYDEEVRAPIDLVFGARCKRILPSRRVR